MRTDWYRLAQVGKIINLLLVRMWVDGSVEGAWRCDDLEEEEEMQFLCTATGVLCLGKGGKYVRGPRERGEGEGEEGISRNDGGKYEREGNVMEGFDSFGFVLLSSFSFF